MSRSVAIGARQSSLKPAIMVRLICGRVEKILGAPSRAEPRAANQPAKITTS
jgi:hypothetical protein